MRRHGDRYREVWIGQQPDYFGAGVEMVIREGFTGEPTYHAMVFNEMHEVGHNEPLDVSRHVLRFSADHARLVAQKLWDLGYRPEQANNEEGLIRELRDEIQFLRKLVGDFPVRQLQEKP